MPRNCRSPASADLASLAQGLSLTFALERRDEPGSVSGSAAYAPEGERLDLDIAAREPAGGLIARAAGMEGLPALEATLKGSGPLDAWNGQLALSAGDVAAVSGAAGIRATPQGRRLTFGLDADVARLLPSDLAPLFEGRTELAGAATLSDERDIAIESFTARAAGFNASAGGRLDAANTADLTFDATLGDAARFAALARGATWRSLRLAGTAKGALCSSRRRRAARRRGAGRHGLRRRHAGRDAAHRAGRRRQSRSVGRRHGAGPHCHRSAGRGGAGHLGHFQRHGDAAGRRRSAARRADRRHHPPRRAHQPVHRPRRCKRHRRRGEGRAARPRRLRAARRASAGRHRRLRRHCVGRRRSLPRQPQSARLGELGSRPASPSSTASSARA